MEKRLKRYGEILKNKYIASEIIAPFNLKQTITHFMVKNDPSADQVTPEFIEERLKDMWNRITDFVTFGPSYREIIRKRFRLMKMLTYIVLSPGAMRKISMSKSTFELILDYLYKRIISTQLEPGMAIGPVAASAFAERITQLGLDSFHKSGTASASGGLGDIKKLLNISKKMMAPTSTTRIYFLPGTTREQIDDTIKRFNLVILKDVLDTIQIIYDPDFPRETFLSDDRRYLPNIAKINFGSVSTVQVRFSIRRQEYYHNRINAEDIVSGAVSLMPDVIVIPVGEFTFRILFPTTKTISEIRQFTYSLTSVRVSGTDHISGISEAEIKSQKYGKETVLYGKGSNIVEVYKMDHVDTSRTISNDLFEVVKFFGIEAAYRVLRDELISIMYSKSVDIDISHVNMIANSMTYKGVLAQINRAGMEKVEELETLQKMSFERPVTTLMDAAISGRKDNMNSISSNIAFLQRGAYSHGMMEMYHIKKNTQGSAPTAKGTLEF